MVHLSKYKSYKNAYIVPEAVTQEGIQRATGCSPGFLSELLKKDIEEGLIFKRKAKVRGHRCKLLCYFLTDKGEKVAKEFKSDF